MRFPVRLLTAGAIVVAGASLTIAGPAGVAGAAKKPKQVTGTCTTLSGNESTEAVSGCTDSADTGGSGTIAVDLTTTTASVTWASGLTSTESFTYKELTGKKDKCPAVSGETAVAEAKEVSVVTGGTATDLIGTKKLKSTDCAYSDASGIVISNDGPVPF